MLATYGRGVRVEIKVGMQLAAAQPLKIGNARWPAGTIGTVERVEESAAYVRLPGATTLWATNFRRREFTLPEDWRASQRRAPLNVRHEPVPDRAVRSLPDGRPGPLLGVRWPA